MNTRKSHLSSDDREVIESCRFSGKTLLASKYLTQAVSCLRKVRELRPDIPIVVDNGNLVLRPGDRVPLTFKYLTLSNPERGERDGHQV